MSFFSQSINIIECQLLLSHRAGINNSYKDESNTYFPLGGKSKRKGQTFLKIPIVNQERCFVFSHVFPAH